MVTNWLLWKYDNFVMLDVSAMLKKRIESLNEEEIMKYKNLVQSLNKQIEQYLIEGYVRKLTPDELIADK